MSAGGRIWGTWVSC